MPDKFLKMRVKLGGYDIILGICLHYFWVFAIELGCFCCHFWRFITNPDDFNIFMPVLSSFSDFQKYFRWSLEPRQIWPPRQILNLKVYAAIEKILFSKPELSNFKNVYFYIDDFSDSYFFYLGN